MTFPLCCQTAMEAGEYASHRPVCPALPKPEIDLNDLQDALFDLPRPTWKEGGHLR